MSGIPPSEKPLLSPLFRGPLHEFLFIVLVTFVQFITQANLGNTIFPIFSIAAGLSVTSPVGQTWFIASYSATLGCFILITGRLGDIYGHRTLLVTGWIWLAVLSVIAGFMNNAVGFDIVRALSGIGPSMMMPNAAALLGSAWEPGDRKKGIAFCVFGAVAPAGYVGGGAWATGLTETGVSWRWIYWSMAVVCAVCGAASWVVVPSVLDKKAEQAERVFDVLGSITGVMGLLGLFIGVSLGASTTWTAKPHIPVILLLLGFTSMIAFWHIERTVSFPILPFRIFSSPTFVAVAVSLSLGWMSFGMFQYYNPHFLILLRGVLPTMAPLQLIPCALIGVVAAPLAVYALPRAPAYVIFGAAMLSFLTGQALLALTPVDQSYWKMTFPTTVIISFGPDLSFACASLIASDNIRLQDQGVAGSFINTVINFSIAIGLALAGNVEASLGHGDTLKGYRAAYWFGAALAGFGCVMTAAFWKGMRRKHGE